MEQNKNLITFATVNGLLATQQVLDCARQNIYILIIHLPFKIRKQYNTLKINVKMSFL